MRSHSIQPKQPISRILTSASLLLALSFALSFTLSGCGGGSSTTVTKAAVNQADTLVNLRHLNQALMLYAQDYEGLLPIAPNYEALKPLVFPYHKDSSDYVDPNTNLPFAWNNYFSGKSTNTEDLTGIATFYVAIPILPNARPVAVFNGTEKLVTDAEWAQLKATSHIP